MDKLQRLKDNKNCYMGVDDFEANMTRDDGKTGAKAKDILEIYPESMNPIILDKGTALELYEYFN